MTNDSPNINQAKTILDSSIQYFGEMKEQELPIRYNLMSFDGEMIRILAYAETKSVVDEFEKIIWDVENTKITSKSINYSMN